MPNRVAKNPASMARHPNTNKPFYLMMLWDPLPILSDPYWQENLNFLELQSIQLMWSNGNINVIARVRGEGWAINSGDRPDSSWPSYEVLLGDEWFYSEINAIAVGKRMADWFDYQSLTPTYAHEYIQGKPYAGGIFPHLWGKQRFGKTLFDEPEDAVPDRLTVNDFVGFANAQQIVQHRTQNIKYVSGFCANAIRKSREDRQVRHSNGNTYLVLGLSNWITKVAQTMKAELDSRNLCYPAYLSLDLEGFMPDMFGYVGTDSEPSLTATPTEISKLFRSSHFRSLQLDPRYATETVWEEWNGSTWIPRTWRDAYIAAGSPQHTPQFYMASSFENQNFVRRISPFIQKMADYALWKTIYEPLKQVFPGIKCGNYYSHISTNPQYYDSHNNNSWLRTPIVQLNQRVAKMRADYQSPVCYSPNILNAVFKYDPSRNVTTPPNNNVRDLGGHRFGTTDTEVYRNFIKSKIVSINPQQSPTIQVIPWLEFPGRRVGGEITPDQRQQRLHTSTVDDLYDIMTYSHDRGTTVFNIFNDFMHITPNHPILSSVAWNGQTISDAIQLHRLFNQWARNKQNQIKVLGNPKTIASGPE